MFPNGLFEVDVAKIQMFTSNIIKTRNVHIITNFHMVPYGENVNV